MYSFKSVQNAAYKSSAIKKTSVPSEHESKSDI